MFKKYGNRTISVDVGEDGAASTAAALKGVDKVADDLDGREVDIQVDKDGSALRSTEGLSSGFKSLASNIRATGTVLAAATIPFAIAGIGAGVPTIAALSSSVAGLAINLGKAGAGFTLVGGAAYAGARGGLAIYSKLIGSVIEGSREAFEATHEHAMKLLEQRRQTILNTKASSAFNTELNDQIIGFSKLQAAVGNRVFPVFTKEMDAWGEVLASNQNQIVNTAGAVSRVAAGFTKWFRTAREGKVLSDTLRFINESAYQGASILDGFGRAGVMAIQPLLPMSNKLQTNIAEVAYQTAKWTESAKGQDRLTAIYHDLWSESMRLVPIIEDLGAGLFHVFAAIDNSGLSDQATNGLASIASGLKSITREGTDSRKTLNQFMQNTETLMPVVGGAVMALVGQLGRIASEAIKARQEGHRLTILQEIFEGIRKSAKPLGNLILGTFEDLGPEIAKLIPNLAKIAETFAGSSGPLTQFVRLLNRAADLFNRLPGPVKSTIANLVALKIILGGLGFGAVAGALGRFASNMFLSSRATGKLTAAMKAQSAVAAGSAAATTGAGAAATKSAGRWGKLGTVIKGAGVALLGFGTLATGGVLLAIAALATAGYLVYKNWDKITKVLSPVTAGFKRLWADIAPFAEVLRESFVAAIKAFASGLLAAIAPGKKFGQQVDGLAKGIRKWVDSMGPGLRRAMSAVSRWLNDNRGTFRAVGKIVGTVVVGGFKLWFKVLQASFGIIRTFIRILGFVGKALDTANKMARSSGKGIRKAIADFTGAGIRIIKGFGQSVVSFWKNRIWEPVASLLTDKSKGMQTTIDNFRERVISIIKALGSAVINYWKNSLWGVAASFLIDKAKGMGGTLDNFKSKAISWVKSLPGTIGKMWHNFWQDQADWVVNIKDGILNTMGNLVGGVKSAWESMANFTNKILTELGLKKNDTKPIPSPGPTQGTINAKGGGYNRPGAARGGLTSGTQADAWRSFGVATMARGGMGPKGGVANEPRLVYGEAGPEAYVTLGRYTPESAEALATANQTWAKRGWTERMSRRHRHGPGLGYRGPIGMASGGMWYPHTAEVNSIVEKKFNVNGSTYPGHGADGDARNSVDWVMPSGWGSHATGSAAAKGDSIVNYLLSEQKKFTDYIIWMEKMYDSGGISTYRGGGGYGPPKTNSDWHRDHVHWESLENNPGPHVMGGSAAASSRPNPKQAKFEKMWHDTIDPWAKKWVARMSPASQFHRGSGTGTSKGVGSIYDWIDAKIPDMIGGGSLPGGSSPKGLTIGEALSQGGWPDSQLVKASSTVWHESGGNARALNPSGAKGLMQIMPQTAKGVGADYGKLFDPVYNTSTGLKVFNQAGGWGPWVGAGMGGDYRNKKVTGYHLGGVIPGNKGKEVLIQAHAGERVLPREMVKAFDRLAHSVERWARGRVPPTGNHERHERRNRNIEDKLDRVVDELREQKKKMLDHETLLEAALRVTYRSPAGRKGFEERAQKYVNRAISRVGG